MKNLEIIQNYLKDVGVYYLNTIDGNKPKSRPIGLNIFYNNKIYFGIGEHKDVYRQMIKNPNIEICAFKGDKFLRYDGTAVFEKNIEVEKIAFDMIPQLKSIYNDKTGLKIALFYIKDATAEFVDITSKKEIIELS